MNLFSSHKTCILMILFFPLTYLHAHTSAVHEYMKMGHWNLALNEIIKNEDFADCNHPMSNLKEYKGTTLLYHAAENQQFTLVDEMLKRGKRNCNINAGPTQGSFAGASVLWHLMYRDQHKLVNYVLDTFPNASLNVYPQHESHEGKTVLWYAAKKGHWHLIDKMLNFPTADLTIKPKDVPCSQQACHDPSCITRQRTPFYYIVNSNKVDLILKAMTNSKKPLNFNEKPAENERTLFEYALNSSWWPIAEKMLEAPDLDIFSKGNLFTNYDLRHAINSKQWDIAKKIITLLINNSDFNTTDLYRSTFECLVKAEKYDLLSLMMAQTPPYHHKEKKISISKDLTDLNTQIMIMLEFYYTPRFIEDPSASFNSEEKALPAALELKTLFLDAIAQNEKFTAASKEDLLYFYIVNNKPIFEILGKEFLLKIALAFKRHMAEEEKTVLCKNIIEKVVDNKGLRACSNESVLLTRKNPCTIIAEGSKIIKEALNEISYEALPQSDFDKIVLGLSSLSDDDFTKVNMKKVILETLESESKNVITRQ